MSHRRQGYAFILDPDQPMQEWDTCQCGHCQRIIFTKPNSASTVYLLPLAVGRWKEEPGAFCRVCMRPVCLPCHDQGRCIPWEKMIEAAEDRERFRRSVGL
jgi:hypothetical protein